jgi:hypothetical protein
MIGARQTNDPNGDMNQFEDIRAAANYDVLEMGGAPQQHLSSGNVAAAVASATIAAVAGRLNFCTGFEFTFAGATAASVVVATLTGLAGGTVSYVIAVPAGAAVQGTPLIVQFSKPAQASGVNIAIVISVPSLGAGNTNACVNLHGRSVVAS